jgi:hypothetical protein
MERQPIHYFVAQGHSLFIPLRNLYPECMVLIEPHERLSPLQCFKTHCHAMKGCPEVLARMVNYLFTHVCPSAQMIYAYFKYRDRPQSIRAGVFDRDLNEPKVIIVNPWGFRKYQKEGVAFEWHPPDEFLFMGSSSGIIPAGNLVR